MKSCSSTWKSFGLNRSELLGIGEPSASKSRKKLLQVTFKNYRKGQRRQGDCEQYVMAAFQQIGVGNAVLAFFRFKRTEDKEQRPQ